MQRNLCTDTIILNIAQTSQNNHSVTLITADKGIIWATLYGGPKSRMKSLVSQWNSGKIWLYENQEKNQIKITDFEVKNFHSTFTQNLFKMYAASLSAEIAIKSHCAGSNEQFFKLISGFLDGMDLCNEEQSRLGLLRFLWRFLNLSGVQPDPAFCGDCGKSFLETSFENDSISYYNKIENHFLCNNCFLNINEYEKSNIIKTNISSIRYLSGINLLKPSESRKLQIDKNCYEQLRNIIFFLIEKNIGTKLNSIETGVGIL